MDAVCCRDVPSIANLIELASATTDSPTSCTSVLRSSASIRRALMTRSSLATVPLSASCRRSMSGVKTLRVVIDMSPAVTVRWVDGVYDMAFIFELEVDELLVLGDVCAVVDAGICASVAWNLYGWDSKYDPLSPPSSTRFRSVGSLNITNEHPFFGTPCVCVSPCAFRLTMVVMSVVFVTISSSLLTTLCSTMSRWVVSSARALLARYGGAMFSWGTGVLSAVTREYTSG